MPASMPLLEPVFVFRAAGSLPWAAEFSLVSIQPLCFLVSLFMFRVIIGYVRTYYGHFIFCLLVILYPHSFLYTFSIYLYKLVVFHGDLLSIPFFLFHVSALVFVLWLSWGLCITFQIK